MSKCREEFEKLYDRPLRKCPVAPYCYEELEVHKQWAIWQAAWNTRGKVDAEICNYHADDDAMDRQVKAQIAEAIKQGNEK